MDILQRILSWLSRLFSPPPPEPGGQLPLPVTRKVMQIVFDPLVAHNANQRLSQHLGWNDVDALSSAYRSDLLTCSHGYLNYQIVQTILIDRFPLKKDGFTYTVADYLQAWQTGSGFHQPDLVDYARILHEFDLLNKVNAGTIDEVWLFGMPYAGFYESIMVGPGAFFVNAPPLNAAGAERAFIIMGFNYQRGVGEMLEAFGHRAEFVLGRVFQPTAGDANLWARFTRYDKLFPGQAECGTVHYAPNSQIDYDWGNPAFVPSRCRNWLNFPDLSGAPVLVNCAEWGDGDIRKHHTWWLSLFPHWTGKTNGISWNWWRYVVDPSNTDSL